MAVLSRFFSWEMRFESECERKNLHNYEKILKDKEFRNAVVTTIIFVSVNVVAHVSLGMCFALLLNAKELKSGTKTVARVIYVLPWVFTASVVAILWKLMLQPSGIVNYLLQFFGLATKDTAWLSERKTALGALLFVSIWNGYPFYMISLLDGLQGIPKELYEACALDGASSWKTILACHDSAAEADPHQHHHAGFCLDAADIRRHLDDDRQRACQLDTDPERLYL